MTNNECVHFTDGKLNISMERIKDIYNINVIQCTIRWANEETGSHCTFPTINLFEDSCKEFVETFEDDPDEMSPYETLYNAGFSTMSFKARFSVVFFCIEDFNKSFRFDRLVFEKEFSQAFYSLSKKQTKNRRKMR